jgi:uncharacterized protein YcbK (DUF882 family)
MFELFGRGQGLKAAETRRLATTNCRATLVALLSVLLTSCSSTSDPTLDLANQSFAATTVAADENTALDMASETVVAEGDAELPEQIAALPTERADETAEVTTAALSTAQPAVTEVSPAEAAKPVLPATDGPALENGGPVLTAGTMPAPSIEPKKKSFLSSFFGTPRAAASPATAALASKPQPQPEAKPLVVLASAEPAAEPQLSLASLGDDGDGGGDALPGVRKTSLFEIKHKSGIDDDSDVDLHEDEEGPGVQLASAAGFARLAPNGLLKQRESVDVACLKPALVRMLKAVERHYGKKMVVTSGYRSPTYNRKVRGARKSQHMYCAAADVQVPGVSKWELAQFVRAMPGRGGVGTYCHTASVHIDVGPERDWNWKCRRRKS